MKCHAVAGQVGGMLPAKEKRTVASAPVGPILHTKSWKGPRHKLTWPSPTERRAMLGFAPQEETGVELASGVGTRFHGAKDGIPCVLVSKPHRCVNPFAKPQRLVPGWLKVLI